MKLIITSTMKNGLFGAEDTEGLSVDRLIEILLHDAHAMPHKICKHRPVAVQHNAVFVINLEKSDLKDLSADDNGSWEIATPRRTYKVERDASTGVVLSVRTAGENDDDVCTLYRQYGTHKATKREKGVDFKRVIATLKAPSGKLEPLAILHYFFKGGKEKDIVLAAHGNARGKNKRPFLRTAASTLQSIKEHCFSKKPTRLYDEGFEKCGGLLGSTSTSCEPRNPKQVYNARADIASKEKGEDKNEIFNLLMQLKLDYASEGGFIQEVTFGKTPEVIVGFDQQLTDLVRFCTNEEKFSVMSIDPTFNLGKFFVTLTTYKHPMLILRRSQQHPIFIGPTFIHMLQTTQSYYGFLTYLIGKKPALQNLKAYGSDGELPLINALLAAFGQETIALRCFLHMKDNLQDTLLKQFSVKPEVKSTVIHDIFGHKVADTQVSRYS